MSDELWTVIPPPRLGSSETTLTAVLALALGIYAVPVIVEPEEPPSIQLDVADIIRCGPSSPPEDWEPVDDDLALAEISLDDTSKPLSREQAIEAASKGGSLFGPGPVAYDPLSSCRLPDLVRPNPLTPAIKPPPESFDDFYLEDSECPRCWVPAREAWYVRERAQLAPAMQPRPMPALALHRIYAGGGLDHTTIRRHLRRGLVTLAECSQLVDPLDLGTIEARFTIDEGRATGVEIDRGPPVVQACITTAINNLEFPRAPARTRVVAPLDYGTTSIDAVVLVR